MKNSGEHGYTNTEKQNGSSSFDNGRRGEAMRLKTAIQNRPEREWISWTVLAEAIDPLACIEMADEQDLHYWEQPEESFAIAAGGAVARLQATGPDRFNRISEQARALRERHLHLSDIPHSLASPILPGGYSFSDHNIEKQWKGFGAARFTLPEWVLTRSGNLYMLTLSIRREKRPAGELVAKLLERAARFHRLCRKVRDSGPVKNGKAAKNSVLTLQSKSTWKEWERQVGQARQMIRTGSFQKIVLARQLEAVSASPINIPHALYHFRHRFPGCFNFMIRTDEGTAFMGASPERLVSLNSRRILTEGLAGSIARGESAVEDLTLGQELMGSKKERSEHRFVVEDIRNSLATWTRRVNHPEKPLLKKLNNVQHLYTPISAEAEGEISIHHLVGSLHPTPAVGGFPREKAVPHITSIESLDRGWYAGPIGWFNLDGNGEFAVAIRSALVNGTRARLYAGSGIVQDSDPEREWEETIIKLRPVLEAIKPSDHEG